MLNKILIFGGFGLSAILVIENMVIGSRTAYIFLLSSQSAGSLSIVSILLGCLIGYGIKGTLTDKKKYEDDSFTDF